MDNFSLLFKNKNICKIVVTKIEFKESDLYPKQPYPDRHEVKDVTETPKTIPSSDQTQRVGKIEIFNSFYFLIKLKYFLAAFGCFIITLLIREVAIISILIHSLFSNTITATKSPFTK